MTRMCQTLPPGFAATPQSEGSHRRTSATLSPRSEAINSLNKLKEKAQLDTRNSRMMLEMNERLLLENEDLQRRLLALRAADEAKSVEIRELRMTIGKERPGARAKKRKTTAKESFNANLAAFRSHLAAMLQSEKSASRGALKLKVS